MLGLALIIILVPVSIYVAAPLAVIGIVSAGLSWCGMTITPTVIRKRFGSGKVYAAWFILCVLLVIATAAYIKFADSYADRYAPVQRM
jgi:hypothetical protein